MLNKCSLRGGRHTLYIFIYVTFLRSKTEPKTRGATYMEGTIIVEVNHNPDDLPLVIIRTIFYRINTLGREAENETSSLYDFEKLIS